LTAYLAREPDATTGQQLLAVFGALQALFVQQDALNLLLEALGIPSAEAPEPTLQKVRDVRNAAVGHPSRQGFKTKTSSNTVVAFPANQDTFIIQKAFHELPNIAGERVDVPALIRGQRECLLAALSAAHERVRSTWEDSDYEAVFGPEEK
jgi:hypothetical protein